MLFGRFIFGIDWGALLPVIVAVAGVVMAASGTGLFLVSLMQNTRQGGVIFGGVLTVAGMIGLIPVFTAGVPNQPESLKVISLLVPQGWAMRSLELTHDGGARLDARQQRSGRGQCEDHGSAVQPACRAWCHGSAPCIGVPTVRSRFET